MKNLFSNIMEKLAGEEKAVSPEEAKNAPPTEVEMRAIKRAIQDINKKLKEGKTVFTVDVSRGDSYLAPRDVDIVVKKYRNEGWNFTMTPLANEFSVDHFEVRASAREGFDLSENAQKRIEGTEYDPYERYSQYGNKNEDIDPELKLLRKLKEEYERKINEGDEEANTKYKMFTGHDYVKLPSKKQGRMLQIFTGITAPQKGYSEEAELAHFKERRVLLERKIKETIASGEKESAKKMYKIMNDGGDYNEKDADKIESIKNKIASIFSKK